jgi:hypothetical protein
MLLIAGSLIVVAGVGIGAYALGRSNSPANVATTTTSAHQQRTTTSTTTPLSYPILAPASVPPVSAECNEAVQMSADGNASPLLCPNGGVNVSAWNNYTGSYGAILALGPSATESTVISTMCAVSPPYPEIESAGILAGHYYGWSFADSTAISDFPFYPSANDNECSS